MFIAKVLEMDGETVEARIRARHSGDQRMMDMLKVITIVFPLPEIKTFQTISQAVYNFCEPVDELEEKIVRVEVQVDMSPGDVAREVLDRVK